MLLSMALFAATGTHLLFIDPQYQGFGNFFASAWTTLMLVKHVLIIGLVVLAVMVDRFVRGMAHATDDAARSSALQRVKRAAEGATGLGAVIVLLTAIAQVAR